MRYSISPLYVRLFAIFVLQIIYSFSLQRFGFQNFVLWLISHFIWRWSLGVVFFLFLWLIDVLECQQNNLLWMMHIKNVAYATCYIFSAIIGDIRCVGNSNGLNALTLQWRHNGHDGVSNHRPRHCLLNCLFRLRSKKTSKPRVTGLYVGNSSVTGEFPAQKVSNAENLSICWRHHEAKWHMYASIKYTTTVSDDGLSPLFTSMLAYY